MSVTLDLEDGEIPKVHLFPIEARETKTSWKVEDIRSVVLTPERSRQKLKDVAIFLYRDSIDRPDNSVAWVHGSFTHACFSTSRDLVVKNFMAWVTERTNQTVRELDELRSAVLQTEMVKNVIMAESSEQKTWETDHSLVGKTIVLKYDQNGLRAGESVLITSKFAAGFCVEGNGLKTWVDKDNLQRIEPLLDLQKVWTCTRYCRCKFSMFS